MKLPNARQMRALDARAINDYGIPSVVLMENAGRGAVESLTRRYGPLAGEKVLIVAGPGNNGGDGLVMARHLHQSGAKPVVLLAAPAVSLRGDAAINYAIVRKLPIELHEASTELASRELTALLAGSRVVVDALFGTGLARPLAGHYAAIVEQINGSGLPVLAVDVPSGLDSDSGQPLGACIRAHCTVTFGLAKPGLVSFPGTGFCGALEVVDIGIPPEVVAAAGIELFLLTPELLSPWLPRRSAGDHKGTFGHLLLVAGSRGMEGAALLAAHGGLRSGVGLATLALPPGGRPPFELPPELMTLPLAEGPEGHFGAVDIGPLKQAAAGRSAMVIGPGLGSAPETRQLARQLYAELPLPMVVDADALNSLAADMTACGAAPPAVRILTPHPGEMARLLGVSSREVQSDRLDAARRLASHCRAVVILKGASTVVAAPDGRSAINPTGNPAMAAGGMGDVLAGLLGGLLAQQLDSFQAACLGVYVHGLAADRLVGRRGISAGLLASEVAAELPAALHSLQAASQKTINPNQ